MVAPLAPAPTGPPLGGPPPLAALLPPPLVEALLAQLPAQVGATFGGMPVEQQNAALLQAAQADPALMEAVLQAAEDAGLIPPAPGTPAPPGQGPPPAGPLPPAPAMPPMQGGPNGPVAGLPAGLPGGPGGVLPGGVGVPPLVGPPVGSPPASSQPPAKPTEPALPPVEPPPDDWEPESLDDLRAVSAWRAAPTCEEMIRLADEALKDPFWQERNEACYDQAWTYYRSRHWLKLNGLPYSQLEGDLIYMLSTPAKQLDRIVARAKADSEHLQFSLDPRSERAEYEEAQQAVENWSRDLWQRHQSRWWERVSQHGPDADLARKLPFLAALHGTAGFSLRPDVRRRKGAKKRDLNADYPVVIDVIPWHELYPLGDCTLRIQRVTMREARRMSAVVRERWPVRAQGARGGEWYPADTHPVRIIGFSDEHGLWFAQCFDVCAPVRRGNRGATPPSDERRECWIVKPDKPIDYGFCLYQCPPGWQSTGDNALPDARQPAENYGRNFARGALFANLEDFAIQDQTASMALSAFRYNRDPAGVDVIDAVARKQAGEGLPDDFRASEGGRNTRWKGEGFEFIPKHFADSASDNFLLSLTYGQTADTFPAALGGGGAAQSGYDRQQMVANAQLLHVEEVRTWVANTVAHAARLQLQLVYRLGTGRGKVFDELPFRQGGGERGEGRLNARSIERAGVAVKVSYWEEDLDKEIHLNNIYLPRLKENVLSMETTRDKLGAANPGLEEQRLDEELGLGHPAMKEARARYALVQGNNPLLPFFEDALLRQRAQDDAEKAGGGMPSMAGQPGVPSGRSQGAPGMPPGLPLPPGMPGMNGS